MAWLTDVIAILIVGAFLFGLFQQLKNSLRISRQVSDRNPLKKRITVGNHLYSLAYAGFVLFLMMNMLAYFGILPQIAAEGNGINLGAWLFLLSMFIVKLAIIPKGQDNSIELFHETDKNP